MRNVVLTAVVVILALFADDIVMAYEEPEYQVLKEREDYEIRRYDPYLVAETVVEGDYDETGDQAFRRLAGFIFGDNVRAEEMSMTTPVTAREVQEPGVEMAMTVPVTIRKADDADKGGAYVWQFVMERKYTQKTLPKPVDPRIAIRKVPERWVAAHRYSGRITEANYRKNLDELSVALERDGIAPVGLPEAAVYNGPFTPPFMRRNEVLMEVDPDSVTIP